MRAAAERAFQESAYVPCSGMSTVWLLRMVFILQTTTTSCRPGGKAPPYTAPFPPRTLRPATTEPRELPTLCRRRYSHPCPHAGPTPGPREAAASAPFPTAGPGPGPEQGGAGGGRRRRRHPGGFSAQAAFRAPRRCGRSPGKPLAARRGAARPVRRRWRWMRPPARGSPGSRQRRKGRRVTSSRSCSRSRAADVIAPRPPSERRERASPDACEPARAAERRERRSRLRWASPCRCCPGAAEAPPLPQPGGCCCYWGLTHGWVGAACQPSGRAGPGRAAAARRAVARLRAPPAGGLRNARRGVLREGSRLCEAEYRQRVRRSGSSPLLCAAEAAPGVLGPVLGSQYERHVGPSR